MGIHRDDRTVNLGYLAQTVVAGRIDRLHIDQIADFQHLPRLLRRGTNPSTFELWPGPRQLAEGNSAGRAACNSNFCGIVPCRSKHDRDTPGIDAGLVFDSRQVDLPVRGVADVARCATPAMAPVVANEAHAKCAYGKVLQPCIERRTNLKAAVVERLFAVLRIETAWNFFYELVYFDCLDTQRPGLCVHRLCRC